MNPLLGRVSRSLVCRRLSAGTCLPRILPRFHEQISLFSSQTGTISTSGVYVSETSASDTSQGATRDKPEVIVKEACGDLNDEDPDDETEKEEMFVDPYEKFEHKTREWGGPRRGGRFPEPTRFGDWERKGRCSDF